jgi:hypothetical protein
VQQRLLNDLTRKGIQVFACQSSRAVSFEFLNIERIGRLFLIEPRKNPQCHFHNLKALLHTLNLGLTLLFFSGQNLSFGAQPVIRIRAVESTTVDKNLIGAQTDAFFQRRQIIFRVLKRFQSR